MKVDKSGVLFKIVCCEVLTKERNLMTNKELQFHLIPSPTDKQYWKVSCCSSCNKIWAGGLVILFLSDGGIQTESEKSWSTTRIKKDHWVTKMYKTAGTVELKFLIFSLCDEQQRVWVHNWNHLPDFVLLMPLSFVFEYREHPCYWTANTSLTFKNVNLKSTSHFNCRHSLTELSHAGGRACCWLIACLVPRIQTSPVQCPSVTGQDTELLVAPQSLGKQ